jgi:taurine dioxygenase
VISVLACIDAESNADPIQFADTAVAYERLDVELKAEIEDLGAFHHVEVSRQLRHGSELVSGQRTFRTRLRQRVFGEARRALLPSAARVITPYSTHPPGVVHPIVTTSPVSGRCAIRLGDHAWRTTGDDEARAVGLIDSLNERLVDSNNVWTHHWRSGDLILYDNSSVLHRRLVAGGPASGRTLRRVMVQLDEQLVVSISQGSGHGLRVDDSIGQGASDEQVDCGGRSAV